MLEIYYNNYNYIEEDTDISNVGIDENSIEPIKIKLPSKFLKPYIKTYKPFVINYINKETDAKYELEVDFSDTLDTITQKILNKTGGDSFEQDIIIGTTLFDKGTLLDYEISPQAELCGYDLYFFVKGLSGETIVIGAKPSDTIENIKKKIQELKGISVKEQRLIFSGKKLEDKGTIEEYNIQRESIIILVNRLLGKSEAFDPNSPDSNNKKPENALEWRMVKDGLNILGKCDNKDCPAFNQEIISPFGFCIFDLIDDSELVKCPVCHKHMIANSFGFHNCFYQLKGIKYDDKKIKTKVRGNKKENDGTKFDNFEPSNIETASWKKLKIFTWENTNNKEKVDICYICKKEIKEGKYQSKCEHSCHKICHDELMESGIITQADECKICFY